MGITACMLVGLPVGCRTLSGCLVLLQGFDLELVEAVASAVTIPVIASSGAGKPEHFSDCFNGTSASAALAAGIFHRGEVSIAACKEAMAKSGIATRT